MAILAAIFPQWRDRDERLCREIVARGICAPTTDLGIAVRATLAHVDSLRAPRDDAERRWEDAGFVDADENAALRIELTGVTKELARWRDAAVALRAQVDALPDGRAAAALLRVVVERDDARAELAALRASIKDIAGRMADNGET